MRPSSLPHPGAEAWLCLRGEGLSTWRGDVCAPRTSVCVHMHTHTRVHSALYHFSSSMCVHTHLHACRALYRSVCADAPGSSPALTTPGLQRRLGATGERLKTEPRCI